MTTQTPTERRHLPRPHHTSHDGSSVSPSTPNKRQGPSSQESRRLRPIAKERTNGQRAIHMRYLAVKARSLLQADDRAGLPGRSEDAIQNLSNLLERQVATAASTPPPAPKSGFDSFPPSTKRMILLVSERDSQGES